jgi:hypothetical protein
MGGLTTQLQMQAFCRLECGTGWFDPTLGLSGIEKGEPSLLTLDLNLHGVLMFFSHCISISLPRLRHET